MNQEKALHILNLPEDASPEEIRKQYRTLMKQYHPDSGRKIPAGTSHQLAQELNEAYRLLCMRDGYERKPQSGNRTTGSHLQPGNRTTGSHTPPDNQTAGSPRRKQDSPRDQNGYCSDESRQAKHTVWDAPVNPYAFIPRDVYQYVYDADGEPIGTYTAGRGAFYWTEEEELTLFIKSVRLCAVSLLEDLDRKKNRGSRFLADPRWLLELTYLLTQTFVDREAQLKNTIPGKDGTYEIPAALERKTADLTKKFEELYATELSEKKDILHFEELSGKNRALYPEELSGKDRVLYPAELPEPGESLYPAFMKNHRLYLKNGKGICLGYLSFRDDRMYQIVIPLFEQKRVQVKILVSERSHSAPRNGCRPSSIPLRLWLRLRSDENGLYYAGELNQRIGHLLRSYEEDL